MSRGGLRLCLAGLALTVIILIPPFCGGCQPESGRSDRIDAPKESFSILITGNLDSTLKPCGCSQGQLGGLDRRRALLDTVHPDRRLVIDTGNFLRGDTRQDRIKFDIAFQAVAMLEYDLVRLSGSDIQVARQLGLLEIGAFEIIASPDDLFGDNNTDIAASATRRFSLDGREVDVVVAAASRIEDVESLFERGSDVTSLNILIFDSCEAADFSGVENAGLVDVVICAGSSTEARVISEDPALPIIVSPGRQGQYMAKITASLKNQDEFVLDFQALQVANTVPNDPEVAQLYEYYKQVIREENLLEAVTKMPLEEGLEYIGSESCRECHEYEYDKWSEKKHANAYQTLVKDGYHQDPECVACHVVGLEYETGFVSDKSPHDMRDVGCEVCHGPGSKHVSSVMLGARIIPTGQPKIACVQCHTPEHSAGYNGHEEEYLRKIVHWREQNTP